MRHYVLLLIILTLGCIESDFPADSPVDSLTDQSWEYQTCGSVITAPAVIEDRVYVPSRDGGVYCLDALSGELMWKNDLGEPMDSLAKGNTTLLAYNDTILNALDLNSGKRLWEFSVGERIQRVVAGVEDVYVITEESLFRVKEREGTVVWTITFSGVAFFERALYVFKDKLFVVETKDTMACYTTDGENLWEFTVQGSFTAVPWVFAEDDTVFLLWGGLYKIDGKSGKSTWALEESDAFLNAVATENHLVVRSRSRILCVDRRTTEILWEKASDFWSCFFGVLGDSNTLSLAAYQSPVPSLTGEYAPLRGALIVQEADGGPIVEVEGAVFAAAVGGGKALFSIEDGLLCFDAVTGKQLWTSCDHSYPYRGITIKDERAYVGSDDGKVYGFLLDNSFSFTESSDIPDYSELGEITSVHVDYLLSYCVGGLTNGEVHLALQDDGVYAVTGYEEQHRMEGEKNFDFGGKSIGKDVVDAFFESVTDLYLNSEYEHIGSTIYADLSVKIVLETGEVILLRAGSDMGSFMPWHIEFRGRRSVQYTGLISIAFDHLMSEIGWEHHHASGLHRWGIASSGLCQKRLTLLEF